MAIEEFLLFDENKLNKMSKNSRKIAEEKLQTKFDIRDFHEVILEEGTVTLAILEERIMNYINNSLKN